MNSYHQHQHLIQKFKLICTTEIPNLYLFDRHVGLFFTKNGTPLKIGMNGQADVWGLYSTPYALYSVEIEFKTGNSKQSEDQKNWQKFIESKNGLYFLVRHEDDHKRIKKLLDFLF